MAYINIKGAFAHRTERSEHPDLISPIWAMTIETDDIPKLLGEVPLTREDLVRILKAREITREELALIVRELEGRKDAKAAEAH